ncbi:MAG: dTDP-4-dehydrorhamnose reductase [Bradyrhizobium sp.]|uniref:dTDP-4-dehydrorhamnose reductase n=1 Tax=Bradyrhizobium sp. TaxID=376 RepID=UPI00120F74EA|nr:dTDP-4-dehydrorhamnose reductase [Bradyrhizobium sp.]THD73084.1 MAG: dTDP-4-dehydrorhamnose reductase [Bradyrhizobium sp.]
MRILVIGRNGQVANVLARLGAAGRHRLTCLGRNDIDVFSRRAIEQAVLRFQPEALINAAGYTAVDKAESDRDAAYALNQFAPRLLAEISAAHRVPFIHLSTDYVFDGTKPTPYKPADPIGPLNIYGASKAAGESAVLSANPAAVILRTAWVYSDIGSNFVKRMLELGAERDELRIVDDQLGNPTFADDIADACLRIASHEKLRTGAAGGIYHFAGRGEVTWFGFAGAIFDGARLRGRRTPAALVAITTDQYPTPARRPANSRLDCTLTEATFGIATQPWEAGLKICLDRLLV